MRYGRLIRMRLLICTTEYYPHGSGIANVAYNVVMQLEKNGVECIICSPTGPDIKLGNQTLIKKTGIIGMLHYWYQVSRYFNNCDYDAVWLHNPYFIKRPSFKHSLVTIHTTYLGSSASKIGGPFYRLYKSFVSKLEHYCLMRATPSTHFTGVSEKVCEEIKKIGVNGNVVYIPNGVDTKRFRPTVKKKELRKKFGISEDHTVLLSVGRLTPQKRPYLLMEVFSQLEKNHSDLILCVAGRGELYDEVKAFAEKHGLNNIIFLGRVDDSDLPDLYACSDYYIMTSRYEGFPLTLLEAMASGLPCIVSDIPNLKIVDEANAGFIINFDNVQVAVSNILTFLEREHPDQAENAVHYARSHLDWEIIADEYLEEFRKVILTAVQLPK